MLASRSSKDDSRTIPWVESVECYANFVFPDASDCHKIKQRTQLQKNGWGHFKLLKVQMIRLSKTWCDFMRFFFPKTVFIAQIKKLRQIYKENFKDSFMTFKILLSFLWRVKSIWIKRTYKFFEDIDYVFVIFAAPHSI